MAFQPGWDLIVLPDKDGLLRRLALWDAEHGLDRYEAATVEDVINDPAWQPVDEVTRQRWLRREREAADRSREPQQSPSAMDDDLAA
jgi:hypothetical protein